MRKQAARAGGGARLARVRAMKVVNASLYIGAMHFTAADVSRPDWRGGSDRIARRCR